MQLRRFLMALGACALLAGPAVRRAEAQNIGMSFDGPWYDWNSGMYSLGYQFNVLSPIMIQALGVFDDASSWIDPNDPSSGPNGLTETHSVGIWDVFGSLLGSATIYAGGGTVNNYYRFVSVTPFLLAVGNGYRIASTTGYSKYTSTDWAVNLQVDPSIQVVQGVWEQSAGLVDPSNTDPSVLGYIGPNMLFTTAPEPATVVLLASGLVGVGLVTTLRRRRALASL